MCHAHTKRSDGLASTTYLLPTSSTNLPNTIPTTYYLPLPNTYIRLGPSYLPTYCTYLPILFLSRPGVPLHPRNKLLQT